MEKLNLPEFDFKLRKAGNNVEIFDALRKKFLVLTPEEWVRQHFVRTLTEHCGYPKALIKTEGGMKVNRLAKRTDILVYSRQGEPHLLVECKAPHVKIDESVFAQASRYNSVLGAPYVVLTNGLRHLSFSVSEEGYNPMEQIPSFP
ncbi:restriction endonuclease subunit R [Fulvitalea axinellae]|uniref:Restriction endonuclease subunit R n=1 Tax=Fulvitalea axinellae TaxID=1182444 RepID=A0AAU9CPJ8_9BACT|nr:restriction endonuclease subunit R [Fulvitalea axinellae]